MRWSWRPSVHYPELEFLPPFFKGFDHTSYFPDEYFDHWTTVYSPVALSQSPRSNNSGANTSGTEWERTIRTEGRAQVLVLSSQSGETSVREIEMPQALSLLSLALIYEENVAFFTCFKDLYVLRAVFMIYKLKQ